MTTIIPMLEASCREAGVFLSLSVRLELNSGLCYETLESIA